MIGLAEAKARGMITGKNGARRVDAMYVEGTFPTISAICISIHLNTGVPIMCQLLCQMPRILKYTGHSSGSRFLGGAGV